MRIRKDITIDQDVMNRFQRNVGKGYVSGKIQELLEGFNASFEEDPNKIDKQILEAEKNRINKDLNQLAIERESIQVKLDLIEKHSQEVEKARLLEERKRIDTQQQCLVCNNKIISDQKSHLFPKGLVCNSCFYENSNKSKLAELTRS